MKLLLTRVTPHHGFRIATALAAISLALGATGCHAGDGADLSGFWTRTFPGGRQVTQMKLQKTDAGYQVISIPAIAGKCILADMPMQLHFADTNELSNLQIKDLQKALVGTQYPRVRLLIGPQGDWQMNNNHISSGYAFTLGDPPSEVRHTDACYDQDGKPVQP